MHDAYIVYPPAKIPVQIESITGYENNVLLGTRQGHLLMYSVQPQQNDNKMDLQLLQYDKNFSKKPILQIEVIPEYQLLFSLTDQVINVHDISRHNFPLVHIQQKTKGATVFTLDLSRPISLTGETTLFVRLCVAVKRKLQFWYWKHDKLLELGNDIELTDVPKTIVWANNTICVGFKTEYILYNIQKPENPEKHDLFPTSSSRTMDPCISLINNDLFALAKDEFLIAVDPNNLTIQDLKKSGNISSSSDVLNINKNDEKIKMFNLSTWNQPIQMLVWDEPYLIGLINDGLEVRSFDKTTPNKDSLIQSINDLQRVRFIIRTKSGLLFVASVTQLWCIQSVYIPKQRQILLQQKKFQLALQLTSISDECTEDKNEKIHQIQTLFAFDLFENKHYQESMKEFKKLKTDPCDVIRLFPDLLPQDTVKTNYHNLEDHDLENGLLALIDYLTEIRYDVKKDICNSIDIQKKFGKNSTPLLSIIDTTLLKCYLQTNDSFVAPLLRLNYCHLEESERTLKKYNKIGELIILYQTKGHHKRSLELLKQQSNITGSSLYGYDRIIQYLQHLGNDNKQLIFEFSGWLIEKNLDYGLKIFTEDIQEVENLPRAEVLDFLLKNFKNLVVPYLEHIIHVWNEEKSIFHNILIQQYREKIKELKLDIENPQNDCTEKQTMLLENTRKNLLEFLIKSNKYIPETVLNDFPYQDLFEERAIILGKLGKHEKVLSIYVQILGDIDKAINYCDNVYNENNKNTIENDKRQNDVYITLIKILLIPPTAPPYSGVNLHPRCLKPDIETVLEILDKNAIKLNPIEILKILPDTIPLYRINNFLELSLKYQLEHRRKIQILKGLLYAEHLQIQEQRMLHETKNVLITEFSVCPVCKKKFGNQSAFVRYANGDIVHFSCQERKLNVLCILY